MLKNFMIFNFRVILLGKKVKGRSQCPRGPKCGDAAARLVGLRFRIPPGSCLPVVSCQI